MTVADASSKSTFSFADKPPAVIDRRYNPLGRDIQRSEIVRIRLRDTYPETSNLIPKMATETDTTAEALRTYVNDMVALDKHIVEAVERQYEDENVKNDVQAHELIGHIKSTLTRHTSDLQSHATRLGSMAGQSIKQAVTGVLGAAAGLYDKVRKDPVSRMLRDNYTALNMASFSLTQLHTTGLALGDQAVASVALTHLQEVVPLIMRLNEVVPYVVVKELTDEGSVNVNAAPEAVKNTQAAWKP